MRRVSQSPSPSAETKKSMPSSLRASRFLQNVTVVVLGFILGILVSGLTLGFLAPKHYDRTFTFLLPASRVDVWRFLAASTPDGVSLSQWAMRLQQTKKATFEVVDTIPNRSWGARMTSPSLTMIGTWTFLLEDAGASTAVTLREESAVSSPVVRALLTIAGRERYILAEKNRLLSHFSTSALSP